VDTDAYLLARLANWTPGRYEIISTAELDPLGGGSDWDRTQTTTIPAWMTQHYPAVAQESDLQLIARLRSSLNFTGADHSVVNQILDYFNDTTAARGDSLLWSPATRMARAVDDTGQLDGVFTKVANAMDRAARQAPTAPGTMVAPGLVTRGDIPNFTSHGFFPTLGAVVFGTNPLMGPLGGTQKLFAVIADYRTSGSTNQRVYDYDLYLVVGDDFGVDEQDVTKHNGSRFADGLAAMWRLQYMFGRKAFMNLVLVKRAVHGSIDGGGAYRMTR
jgi:hypothetical protein